jgi:hypothetical protein
MITTRGCAAGSGLQRPAARPRRWHTSVAVLAVMMMLLPGSAAAQDGSGAVTATVTVIEPVEACVLLSVTSIDFGTLVFGERTAGIAYDVESCSLGEQLMYAATSSASNAGETVAWEPILSEDTEIDRFAVSAAFERRDTRSERDQVLLSTEPARVETLAAGAKRQAAHRFYAPQPGSAGAGEAMTFQLTWFGVLDE